MKTPVVDIPAAAMKGSRLVVVRWGRWVVDRLGEDYWRGCRVQAAGFYIVRGAWRCDGRMKGEDRS